MYGQRSHDDDAGSQKIEIGEGATAQNIFQVIINHVQGVRFDYANRIQNFLIEYLGAPGQPVSFGGRETELRKLDGWLADDAAPPYALLAAPAGRGKSALLVRWLRALDPEAIDVAFVPISIRFNTALSSVVFAGLAAQLARIYDEPLPETFYNWSGDQWRDLCLSYLNQTAPGNKPVLLILDGIDEAADWQAGPDLFPALPSPGLRVLVSARYLGGDRDAAGWLARLGWERPGLAQAMDLPILTEAGVRAVLEAMGSPLDAVAEQKSLVGELFRLSEGDPLLVGLYVKALLPYGQQEAALRPKDLERLEPGLHDYFENWWEYQESQWKIQEKDPLDERLGVDELLSLLALAFGPPSRNDLARLAPRKLKSGRRLKRTVGNDLWSAWSAMAKYGAMSSVIQS